MIQSDDLLQVKGNFVIAFMGSGQTAHFENVGDSRFANIDPNHSSIKMKDEPLVFVNNIGFCVGRGVVSGLQEALEDLELTASAMAVSTAIGISVSMLGGPITATVVAVLSLVPAVIGTIQSLFMIAQSAGGIYSTATGTGTFYDKVEAFAHDFIIMAVGITVLTFSVITLDASLSILKSAAMNLFGRTSRLTPSEVTKTYKGAKLITSFDDFAEYAKGFLDEDALKYAKEVLGNDADDVAKLQKIAQLVEDGSKKIGKKLSKEELKAGLDALWNDGGVEGALGAIERCFKNATTLLSGKWEPVNEHMSAVSREYQKQITGKEGMAWIQNGVKYDGMKDGVLLEVKAKYAQFIDKETGTFMEWFSKKDSFINQAKRQIDASEGAKIQWYFAEEDTLNAVKALFYDAEIFEIEFIFEPIK